MKKQALVAIIMGSDSDWPIMKAAAQMLADLISPTPRKWFLPIARRI